MDLNWGSASKDNDRQSHKYASNRFFIYVDALVHENILNP